MSMEAKKSTVDVVTDLVAKMKTISAKKRAEVMQALAETFCIPCGAILDDDGDCPEGCEPDVIDEEDLEDLDDDEDDESEEDDGDDDEDEEPSE